MTSKVSVKVKWGKETYNAVEVDMEESPMMFKAQLYALTGVAPERQKVMIKGGTVVKDDDWGSIKLSNGSLVMLMGSKNEDVPAEPVQKTVFVEDMTESQLAVAMDLPRGLNNLGNTCYMNATVQCLRSVPELKEALRSYGGGLGGGVGPQSITAAMRDLFAMMEVSPSAVSPLILLNVVHMAFPRFAEKSEHGGFAQQDANECWVEFVRMLQQKLAARKPPLASSEGGGGPDLELVNHQTGSTFIDQYFGGVFDVTIKCKDTEDEPATRTTESFLQLSCFISQEVKYLHSGLKSRLEEVITKFCPTLDKDAQYTKTSKISRLPAYLTVQFVRFYYKEKESINAKILKDIKFPLSLDVFDLCSSELQQRLSPMRTRFKEVEDRGVEDSLKGTTAEEAEKRRRVDEAAAAASNGGAAKKQKKSLPYSFETDIGSNNSGYYELQAVLTHRGRSSSSGHYVAWVRRKADDWIKFDDDKVSPVSAEDILKLSGGGDWHCAYVLLYGPRILEVDEDEPMEIAASSN